MDFIKEYEKLPKEMVYEMYEKIVYETKDYDDITRKKMLEEIKKQYEKEDYLYHICSKKELDFLEYISNHKLKEEDLQNYNWEIYTLNEKAIFSEITFQVFDYQKENVAHALKIYQKEKDKKNEKDYAITLIGMLKMNANMLTLALKSLMMSLFKVSDKGFEALLGHPLIHYYCDFYEEYVESFNTEEEFIYYRDYLDILDDVDQLRKEYGIAGSFELNFQIVEDMFYYDFPIHIPVVKKMFDHLKEEPLYLFLARVISDARLTNHRDALSIFFKRELLNEVNAALDEMPCAVMNGISPKVWEKEKKKEFDLNKEFSKIPQHNAHLCKKAADEFYDIYLKIIDYVNQKEKIVPRLKKILKQEQLKSDDISQIDEYLWRHKELLQDFLSENENNLSEIEVGYVKEFQNAIYDTFVIVGYEREYTQILSKEGKLYMVKGIREDIDKCMTNRSLPKIITTALFMFKGQIIYSSIMKENPISFGNDFVTNVLKEKNAAITYYHL